MNVNDLNRKLSLLLSAVIRHRTRPVLPLRLPVSGFRSGHPSGRILDHTCCLLAASWPTNYGLIGNGRGQQRMVYLIDNMSQTVKMLG